MYWVVESSIDDQGKKWVTYNFHKFIKINNAAQPFYNGLTKVTTYPQKYHVVVSACKLEENESFEEWYHTHRESWIQKDAPTLCSPEIVKLIQHTEDLFPELGPTKPGDHKSNPNMPDVPWFEN